MENKYKFNVYPLSEIDGGGFYAEVPELPGCIASAATLEETIKLLEEAIDSWIEVSKSKGNNIPKNTYYEEDSLPSGRFSVRMSRSSHKKLLEIAEKENESLNATVTRLLDQMLAVESVASVFREQCIPNNIGEDIKITSTDDNTWDFNVNSSMKPSLYFVTRNEDAKGAKKGA